MQGYLSHLKGMVEVDDQNNLRIVVLENLIVRREFDSSSKLMTSMQTELLVKDGQVIDAKLRLQRLRFLQLKTVLHQ